MESIIKNTMALIKFKSTGDRPKELVKCRDWIASQLPKKLHIVKGINNEKPYLIVTVKDTKTPEIFFTGHFDVVPAEDKEFEPSIKEDKLYGRGSADMKGGIAILMEVIKDTDKDVGIIFTGDEELSGKNGMGFLVNNGYRAKFVAAAEPSDEMIVNKEKGVFSIRIYTAGKAGHSSMPWVGDNAIEKMIKIYPKIRKLLPPNPKNDNQWRTSTNLAMFNAGDAFNKIPDSAEIVFDIRYTETDDLDGLIKKISSIDGVDRVEVFEREPMLNTSEDDHFVQKFKENVESAFKKKVKFKQQGGASDTRYFGSLNIPAVDFGPIGENLHAPGEWVSISSLEKCYKAYKNFVDSL